MKTISIRLDDDIYNELDSILEGMGKQNKPSLKHMQEL